MPDLERREEKPMAEPLIASRASLPCTVPPGGVAVVLAAGRAVPEGVQGPGALDPKDWRKYGQPLEAVLFPATTLPLYFDVAGLPTREGVGLDLTVTLSLRLEEPVRFLTDVVRDASQFTGADLAGILCDAVRTGLAQGLRHRALADLEADPNLRGWLGTAIEHYLTAEADLLGRSGLAVVGVDAFDLRCQVWDREREVRETYYLRAALAQAEAEGRKLLDRELLAQLQEHLPVKKELVDFKEDFAELVEREAKADARLGEARKVRQAWLQDWIAVQGSRPSSLRPELWRRDLGEPVHTAPLCDGSRVYVATQSGRVFALDRNSGEPAWPQPAELGAAPGDGLALAAGCLWIPGHDGALYGLDPASGAGIHRVEIGGRLSSAPLPVKDLLYLSVDVDAPTLRPGAGDVVAVDARRGAVAKRWTVSQRGLRAQPAVWEQGLYVGDRAGGFYALDLPRGRVEALPVRGGRILAPALVDAHLGQVIVGDSYGWLLALDRSGRERWVTRLGGAVVGQPLLYGGVLYAGAGDGRVYGLDPSSGQPVREPFQTRNAVATPPLGWQDLVLVGSNDGYLYALEADSGHCFWQYHSGSPVSVPPAVTPEGQVYVVDRDGRLNALRWCLARYTEGAHRAEDAQPARLEEAAGLWMLAGETQAALEAAERAGRLDLVADLAWSLNWYERAAECYQLLAQRSRDPLRGAAYWAEAAEAWEFHGRPKRADRCRLLDAQGRNAPLLRLEAANRPSLTLGQPDVVQIRVVNCTKTLAREVQLAYEGHVQRGGEHFLGSIGPEGERLEEIEVMPTESGSATLRVRVRYADAAGRPQRPVPLDVRLKVAQPPEVHHHYYGPVVGRDGVIIVKGEAVGGGRQIRVQSGEDAIELGRSGQRICPACGAPLAAGGRYCMQCGSAVP
jgi:outer membrane protein assembly factor BamB